MRLSRTALCATLSVATTVAVLTAGTGSAAAVDEMRLGVVARSTTSFSLIPDGVKVCFHGEREAGWTEIGQWTMSIDGVRDLRPVIEPTWTSALLVVNHCVDVKRDGAATGSVRLDFGYSGVGSYVFGRSIAGVVWDPSIGIQPYAVDPAS